LGSTNMIVGTVDYFDYYRAEGVTWKTEYDQPRSDNNWSLIARNELHSSLAKTTDYSLLKPSMVQRPNPAIEEGWMRSITLKYVNGDDLVPFAIIGQNRLEVQLEVANSDLFGSDYDFTRVHVAIDRRFPTFYKRRFLPN